MDDYYNEKREVALFMFLIKEKHLSFLNVIPERYKRLEYIIDRISSNKH